MNGIVIIDKPAGKTSHDVVSEVKKIMGAKKAGHTGTLDPMATGVLPVCLNEATKLAQFLSGENKEYLATMLLGVKTDTLDTEGEITGRSDKFVSEEKDRFCLYCEEILDILGINSSGHLINVWRYGIPF